MLLTDGCPNTVDDLRVYESAILDVAAAEQIDLKTKLGLAAEEVAEDVLDVLLNRERVWEAASPRRARGVSDVVVSKQLKRWHALHSLAVVYRDAFHNQLNDRYQAKFEDYREWALNARAQALRFGLGLVFRPIARAAQPSFTFTAAAVALGTYYIQAAWVSADGQEGAPSELTTFEPPAGSVPVVDAGAAPANAVAFNVYAGLTPGTVLLQNSSPVMAGQTFAIPAALANGRAPGSGQSAETYVSGDARLHRG